MKRIFLIGWIAVFLVGCGGSEKTPTVVHASAGPVRVVTAAMQTVPEYVEAVGTVRTAQTSEVAAQIMANIVSIRVQEGDRVRRGEPLVLLDARETSAAAARAAAGLRVAQDDKSAADAEYALAQSTYERYRGLQARNSVSPYEMDQIEAQFKAATARREQAAAGVEEARAAASQARTMAGYTQLRAPFDGVVTARLADEGTLASPGMPVLTVEDPSSFRLEVTVDEGDMPELTIGEAIPVTLDALGSGEIRAEVARLAPAADPRSRTFLVKLDLPRDSRLRSGLFGKARLPQGTRPALLLPASAMVAHGQVDSVYVVSAAGAASLRFVTLGSHFGDQVEVLSGVEPGERVVSDPGQRDLDGARVEVSR